ncbi:phage tail tape measure protein [Clostridium hydrogeniformans]|uniref:phage tail tape measure protein n=1 Tax=Clostridium hydrogeniformans TaxID=349933 RepID=UPI00048947B7|nr:phage tail tape measure protein [Clostridium hydrogeniformans]
MELFTLFGKIAVNDKDANKSIDSVTGKAKQSEGVIGKAFSGIGKTIAKAFAVGAVVAFEKKIVSTYSTYDDQMRKVQAVSGATGKAYEALRGKAEELGAKTRFSATEAGQGMENLARAGWKTGEIMEGIGPVLSFATANAIDLGSAAGIVADGLSQFGLTAKDTTMFTDILSATASAANTDIGLLGETFKYVGPVAGSLGYKLQDVSVAIGLMANKGIKGSQAGTSLRSALTRLANPTGDSAKLMRELGISITDSTGKVKPFNTLMQELRGKFSKLNDAQKAQYASTIFGQEAMSGMLAVVNATPEEFEKMTKAVAESEGQTQKMADTMDGGLGGAIAGVKSAWEGLLIKLGEMQNGILVDAFNKLAQVLQSLPNEIEYVSNKFKEFTNFLKEHETAIKAIGIIFGAVITSFVLNSAKLKIADVGIKSFIKGFKAFKAITPIIKGAGTAFSFLTSPVGLAGIAIGLFAAAAYLIYKNWDKIGPWLSDLWNGIKETVVSVWNSIKEFFINLWNGIKEIFTTSVNAIGEFFSTAWQDICDFFVTAWEVITIPFKFIWELIKSIVKTGMALIEAVIGTAMQIISQLWEYVWNFLWQFLEPIWEGIKSVVQAGIGFISNIISAVGNFISNIWNTIWSTIVGIVTSIWNEISYIWNSIYTFIQSILNSISNVISSIWNSIKGFISSAITSIKNIISSVWNTISSITSSIWNGIKGVISGIWNGIKSVVSGAVNGVKSSVTGAWNSIKSVTTTVWNGIKTAIWTPIEKAQSLLSGFVDKVKGWFSNLFPKVKLPHFKINGEFSLMPPRVPSIGIDWYAEGGILTKPTMFGMMNGRAQVGGEAGPEAVIPIEKLEEFIYNSFVRAINDTGLGDVSMDGYLVAKRLSPHLASMSRRR